MNKINRAFIGLTLGVFIILFFSRVFQQGLFFDGLIYSAISDNLANGVGSFWAPSFSQTICTSFYGHPPLVFGLESAFMWLFDGAFFSEKLYSFLMAVLSIAFIALIWRKIVPKPEWRKLYWLPILCWIITPKNSWAFSNNILENTMSVFCLASIYVLLISVGKQPIKKVLYLLLAAVLLFFAFLSKGFPGLFPLGFFLLFKICFGKQLSAKQFIIDTAIFVLFVGLIFGVVFYFNAGAQNNIRTYLEVQVFAGLKGESRVGSRLVLMKNLFNELIPLLILAAIVFGVHWKKIKGGWYKNESFLNGLLFFVLIGLSASVPLMISPKVSSFYLICALPYFALAFGVFLAPLVAVSLNKFANSKLDMWASNILGFLAIAVGVTLTIININSVGRDQEIINDMDEFEKVLPINTTISVHSSYRNDWTTFAYFQRYMKVSINKIPQSEDYYLIPVNTEIPEDYELVECNTLKFDLLKRKNNSLDHSSAETQ